MSNVHSISEIRPRSAEPLTFAQQEVLERAVAKIVLLGELVGVSADQMILLLELGLDCGRTVGVSGDADKASDRAGRPD